MRMFWSVILLAAVMPASAGSLFELKVGMTWTYVIEGDNDGQVTNKIADAKLILGNRWFQLIEFGDRFWIRNSDIGQVEAVNLFDSDAENVTAIEELVIFKYPATAGEKWNESDSPITYLGKQRLQVPAGDFDCHVYHIHIVGDSYSKYCVAEGVGVIYNESILDDDSKRITKLLEFRR